MHKVVLGLGGNVGDVKYTLMQSLQLIEDKIGKIVSKSSLYETEAWGKQNQPVFLNQVVIVLTKLDPMEVLSNCNAIEYKLGRNRSISFKWGRRTLDIDILLYNDEVINLLTLKIPHPYLHERNFVLAPLKQLLPNYIHPVLNMTITDLKKQTKDKLQVKALTD